MTDDPPEPQVELRARRRVNLSEIRPEPNDSSERPTRPPTPKHFLDNSAEAHRLLVLAYSLEEEHDVPMTRDNRRLQAPFTGR